MSIPAVYPVAIIGCGPAGLSAAIQLKRYGVSFILLERAEAGGLLRNANLVENYPGFPDGIRGSELVARFLDQMERLSIRAIQAEVIDLSYEDGIFQLVTSGGNLQAHCVVIASGTKPRIFSDISIPPHLQPRVYYEVHPLATSAGQRIAIVGAGDAAFDYALNLARQNDIFILNRSDQPSCLPLLWQRASVISGITYYENTHITKIESHPSGGMSLQCASPRGELHIQANYLVGALGRSPQLDFLQPPFMEAAGALEKQGVLYWIGDVKNGIFRQTSIAVGDGILAAMKIYRHVKETS